MLSPDDNGGLRRGFWHSFFVRSRHFVAYPWIRFKMPLSATRSANYLEAPLVFSRLWHGLEQTAFKYEARLAADQRLALPARRPWVHFRILKWSDTIMRCFIQVKPNSRKFT